MRAPRLSPFAVSSILAALIALGCNEEGQPSTPVTGAGGSTGGSGGTGASSPGGVGGAGGAASGGAGAGGRMDPTLPEAGGPTNEPAGDPYVFAGSTNGMLRVQDGRA